MRSHFLVLALLLVQMNTMQDKRVVHLQPNGTSIETNFGGEFLELINAPSVVHLPIHVPTLDSQGAPWSVDVKNLGPAAVRIVDKAHFSAQVSVGQTIHIFSTGTGYIVKR